MKTLRIGLATLISLFSCTHVWAQYVAPPPPAPFAGFVNEALRKCDPSATNWNLSGDLRLRYEIKDGFAIPGIAGSMDFRAHGADVFNDYFLSRLRLRAAYS